MKISTERLRNRITNSIESYQLVIQRNVDNAVVIPITPDQCIELRELGVVCEDVIDYTK